MPTADLQTWQRPASDIDWIEEEAWLRAGQYTPTPQLIFALKALIFQEIQLKPGEKLTPYDWCREAE
jgi:hypothetical protein